MSRGTKGLTGRDRPTASDAGQLDNAAVPRTDCELSRS